MIIPPFAGVRLVEYRDRLELAPVYWYRNILGLGRWKAKEVGPQPGSDMLPFFNAIMADKEIWVIVNWHRYEDGQEEPVNIEYLDPQATEAEARKAFARWESFLSLSGEELASLAACIDLGDEEEGEIQTRPDV